ncbi:F-box/FBD/LRR-repeat protein At5g18770-like [Raphanus sativus]|uniref:F-box/FBD/LRR-repeat protein At5g18770-like n=1 Tax=Raphanus sativus TaxID=3726 RepID=A0A6J0MNF6_RAPSA|nr:F-box/FBD/LRR-repeat protein At5g18770-like [Raphanus sativus]
MSITEEPNRSLLREEVGTSRGKDRISLLHDSLLCHILSFRTRKEVVWTSVLSSRWRDLWKWVPRLELDSFDFPNNKACVYFINKFLPNVKSLSEFKLIIGFEKNACLYERCLGKVMECNIQHFSVENDGATNIPLTLLMCQSLVSLKLYNVKLNDFASLTLPCLKIMDLDFVIFPHDAVLDTPRLERLILKNCQFESFEIIRMSGSVKVHIDVDFQQMGDDLSERNIIYNFLNNFSAVGHMTLSESTLELIYCLRDMNPLPNFHGLTSLRATIWLEDCLILLPLLLESCPNLKSLTLELINYDNPEAVTDSLSCELSFCLVSFLEYIEIETAITEQATEQEVVRYFLGNATLLKKLVLRLNLSDGEKYDPVLLKQRFDSPRRCNLCQFEVLFRMCSR